MYRCLAVDALFRTPGAWVRGALLSMLCLGGPAGAVVEPAGYWRGEPNSPVPATLAGGTVLHVEALAALLRTGRPVVVDVSRAPIQPPDLAPAAPWMPVPHQGLPTAVWIPDAGDAAPAVAREEFFRRRLAQATRGDLDVPVVVYCHRACWLSWNAAKRAIGYGYHRVYWFPDGIEGWVAARQPTVALAPSVEAVPSAAGALPTLVVLDLELTGDLGGPEFEAEHAARLGTESLRLRAALARIDRFRLLDESPARAAIDALHAQQAYLHECNGCDLDIGRALNADLVMVAWVNRVSGLILTLTYELHDVKSGQIAGRKSYDFRGDNDNTWNHAIDYMVRDLKSTVAIPAAN